MSATWACKECENVNSVDSAKCICGENRPTYAAPAASTNGIGGCTITGCPMPGGLSPSFGPNARWYCRWHFSYRNDPVHCSRITEELKENRPKISGCKPNGEYVNNPVPVLRLKTEHKE